MHFKEICFVNNVKCIQIETLLSQYAKVRGQYIAGGGGGQSFKSGTRVGSQPCMPAIPIIKCEEGSVVRGADYRSKGLFSSP